MGDRASRCERRSASNRRRDRCSKRPDGARETAYAWIAGRRGIFTNLGSKKGQEIANNPQAALVLHWKTSERQLRFRGLLEPVSEKEADAYFATRPYRSRVGAWASRQSAPLASRALLIAEAARIAASYPTAPPRPSFWHGFLLRPLEIEFWNSGDFRLHDRFRWRRNTVDDSEWNVSRLHP